jgi:hypothetical protein
MVLAATAMDSVVAQLYQDNRQNQKNYLKSVLGSAYTPVMPTGSCIVQKFAIGRGQDYAHIKAGRQTSHRLMTGEHSVSDHKTNDGNNDCICT